MKKTIVVVALGLMGVGAAARVWAGPPAYPGANGQPFQAIQGQIDSLAAQIQTLEQKAAATADEIANLEADIESIRADIASLETRAGTTAQTLSNLQWQLLNHQGQLNGLYVQQGIIYNQIAALQSFQQNSTYQRCGFNSSIAYLRSDGTPVCRINDTYTYTVTLFAGSGQYVYASCPGGDALLSGGYFFASATNPAVWGAGQVGYNTYAVAPHQGAVMTIVLNCETDRTF